MPPSKQTVPTAVPAPQEPQYPVIEAFIEQASSEDIDQLFQPIREALEGLKGTRAEQGRKVQVALERTEELLSHLLQVREKLGETKKGSGPLR